MAHFQTRYLSLDFGGTRTPRPCAGRFAQGEPLALFARWRATPLGRRGRYSIASSARATDQSKRPPDMYEAVKQLEQMAKQLEIGDDALVGLTAAQEE